MVALVVALVLTATLTIADLEAFGFAAAGLVGLGQLFAIPVAGLVALVVGWKKRRPRVRSIGLAMLVASILSLVVSAGVLGRQETASKALGDALCAALEDFREERGRYPDELRQLVPDHLAEVPVTAMGVVRSVPFHYQLDPTGQDFWLGFDSTFFIACSRRAKTAWRCDD